MHRHQRLDVLLVGDWVQFHARGRWHVEGEVGDLGDEQGLGRLGREPGRKQPVGEVWGLVVGVVLPLPGAMQLREAADLRGDDRVGALVVEVTPGHPGPPVPDGHDPNHAVVMLDVSVRRVRLWVPA
jgi:hypothetical protein